ncbi:MAG: DNA-binding protein [Lactobacillus crispatus]|nr:DNA-binding protein [Lactobacillus crispatus]
MNINLDDAFIAQIVAGLKPVIIATVQGAIKDAKSDSRPYLNRTDMAKYLGVSQSTVGAWAEHGMPFAVVDGRKLYGKQTVNQWLKEHEITTGTPSQHQKTPKKPATIGVVTSNEK